MTLDRDTLAASPRELARAGIVRDPFALASGDWRCESCSLGLQNGLTGAREHYDQVHLQHHVPPTLYVVKA